MRSFSKNVALVCVLLSILFPCLCGCMPVNSFDTSNLGSVPQPSIPETTNSAVLPQPKTLTVYQIGDPACLELTAVQTTVADIPLEYGWAMHNGNVFLKQFSGACQIAAIPGSDRYICAYVGSMVGVYHYLIEVETGTVLDPLRVLQQDVMDRVSEVEFSPDGQYAFVTSHSGTQAYLLDCVAGEATQLPLDDGIYSVSAHFVDATNLFLTTAYQKESGQIYFELSRYEIATGACTEIPGQYQSKDRSRLDFLSFADGGVLYTFTNGQLTLIDPLTWNMTTYPFGDDVMISQYTDDSYIVVSNGIRYLLRNDGAYQQITP